MIELRDQVLNRFRAELLGPAGSDDEAIVGRPYWRYLCGMLFPSSVASEDLEEDDEKDAQAVTTGDEQADPAIALAYDALPSSMGISFFVSGATVLSCGIQGARYEPDPETTDRWVRRPLGTSVSPTQVELRAPKAGARGTQEQPIWGGRARVTAVFRPRANGHLVTVSLVNAQNAPGGGPGRKIEQMLFQCQFTVHLPDGSIGEYPTIARYSRHEEDEELAVAYGNRKTFGIGHGCAASWDPTTATVHGIKADPLPTFEVRGLTTSISLPEPARRCLDIRWLADPRTPRAQLRDALEAMVDAYRKWVDGQEEAIAVLDEIHASAATRMVQRQRVATARMQKGIKVLFAADEAVLEAFRIAQEAMLRQFLWVARRTGPKGLGEGNVTPIDPWIRADAPPSWRPFQLAFQLVVIESLADPESPDRDTLDLLWFPTGGGKTEAYLALAAFEIALRRIRHGEAGAGTAVLMRYTLRLLTSQQFERAATLISVLETMRQEQPRLGLGEQAIRLGLWVGGSTTPNALDHDSDRSPGARQLLDRILDDETPENPFQLRTCPYCGTRIIPTRKSARRSDYGVEVTPTAFKMNCPDSRCVLNGEIPVSMVDADLYRRPPTFLIGTIDKFARMVWDASSRVFFGGGSSLPPSLIIQDELHLITGPLGTIAGLYEAGIDSVLKSRGLPAKYVAATATIQRATEQSRTLYARAASVFPPPGLDAANSFFSKEDLDSPGRTFVGAMGHGLYSSLTSLIQVSAAAAAVSTEIPESQSLARDSYWTQVIYHNSRQELGKTTTMLRDDVRTRLSVLQPDEARRREFDSIEELSANLKGSQISEAIERMQVEWPNPTVIDAVACTNMISVGVDIARLGLMIVKGQPKATSEYIQASSRVGRDPRRLPGIVLALYSATRPRDRSHYETFQSYHQSLYRVVEPATVTPFSPPARERALHAGLVLALRHTLAWIEPRDAGEFDPNDPEQASIIQMFRTRLLAACREDERAELLTHLDTLLTDWARWRDEPGSPLSFSDARQFHPLLAQFPSDGDQANGHWPTLNSMRHVDGEVAFGVRGEAGDE